MAGVGRDLWGASSPTAPAEARYCPAIDNSNYTTITDFVFNYIDFYRLWQSMHRFWLYYALI